MILNIYFYICCAGMKKANTYCLLSLGYLLTGKGQFCDINTIP